ncbi:YifB family Mg chelatase-like AAA ATPase [Pikeienuella piscinae]|uniref:YifB family Mg chelatase-like AAA ATPase n=1 Tax=Pikeienuella piscinae TaxID=2748098 RepID=A0A7L5C2K5_9RHOB|nr:YifB family Mg chelatase-like AAA ATPase [Pikeienuella piscinae]QIE56099.1 YifB family Mg chelatase-like AAA ATPase [Pikeienuella piscinae]
MALAYTVAFQGMEAREVEVQCHLAAGLPAFTLVGLPDKAVAESKERVRAALNAIGLALPPRRITINLAPADLPKEGAHYDLPIALALLAALEVAPAEEVARCTAMGELSLDGRIGAVAGALPAALAAAEAERDFICPAVCGPEAAIVGAVRVLAPETLVALINHFSGRQPLAAPEPLAPTNDGALKDLADVRGQEMARRALEVAAAGGHNMLMIGPPGAGKSMLAERLPGILPPMEPGEALEVSMIHSVAGLIRDGRIPRRRPFLDPHYGASMAAMVGGGRRAAPGQISLAHNGVLFLDELPEFARPVLESLRQPLETGETFIARANAHVRYPARFQLVAAMNPCRCGQLSDPALACSRAPTCGLDYQARISGPLLDRLDVQIELPGVTPRDLSEAPKGEPSAPVAARVARARAAQRARFEEREVKLRSNAELSGELLEEMAAPDREGRELLDRAAEKLRLTGRGYHRVMRLARTIADLEGREKVGRAHIAEAAGYRRAPLKR